MPTPYHHPFTSRCIWFAGAPGGILAIWSAYPDRSFGHRLHAAGFDVEEMRRNTDGSEDNPDHTIWLATAPGSGDRSDGMDMARAIELQQRWLTGTLGLTPLVMLQGTNRHNRRKVAANSRRLTR